MQEREEAAAAAQPPVEAPKTPAAARTLPQQQVSVDAMPAEAAVLAAKPVDERIAIYLNSIRRMLIFFTVLVIIGIAAGVILALMDIHAVHQAQTCTGLGC